MGHLISKIDVRENIDKRDIMNMIQNEARRNGDGYSSSMTWHENVLPLKNREEAEKFIEKKDNGFYDDHAVRYFDYSNAKETKILQTYREKLMATKIKLKEYEKKHSIKVLQAKFLTCSKCGSKINKDYIHRERCPICNKDLRSKTILETIDNYNQRILEIEKKIQEEKEKQKGEVKWLVKYEYHV